MPALFRPGSQPNLDNEGPQWHHPSIFVKFEFGVAFSPTKSHGMAFSYASRREASFGDRGCQQLDARSRDRTLQPERHRIRLRSRSALQLGRGSTMQPPEEYVIRPYQSHIQHEDENHQFSSVPGNREYPVREYYAPEVPFDFWQSRDYHESRQRPPFYSMFEERSFLPPQSPHHHSSLPPPPRLAIPHASQHASTSAPVTPLQSKPLPPLPSTFRLGEDDLPWSSPTWDPPLETIMSEPVTLESQRGRAHSEDPQRMHALEVFQEALLSVDSMEADWWDPEGSRDSRGDLRSIARGPRGLGWAVRVDGEENPEAWRTNSGHNSEIGSVSPLSPPPSYLTSEWDRQRPGNRGSYYGHVDLRRRSSR